MTDIPHLGVTLMDRDHAEIEALLTAPPGAPADAGDRFDRIETAIVEHFAREEALMGEAGVPILPIHHDLHVAILDELHIVRSDRTAGRLEAVAVFLAGPLPQMIVDHINSADTATAEMLRARGFGADEKATPARPG